MKMKIKQRLLDDSWFILLLFFTLQLVFLRAQNFFGNIFGSQEPILIFLFMLSCYFGYKKSIIGNLWLLLTKILIIIIAIILAYFIDTVIYSAFVPNAGPFLSELALGGGYKLMILGMVLSLVLPTYILGLLLGSFLAKLKKYIARNN